MVEPSFLAIMGAQFLPPIQLSFGFSLDRVGGIVGVNRRADTEALRAAQRTGTAGDVLFAIRPPANALALVTRRRIVCSHSTAARTSSVRR